MLEDYLKNIEIGLKKLKEANKEDIENYKKEIIKYPITQKKIEGLAYIESAYDLIKYYSKRKGV